MKLNFLEGRHSIFFAVLPERDEFGYNKYVEFDCIEDAIDFRRKMSTSNLIRIYEEVSSVREVG